jgi:hypothetical protein
MKINTGKTVLKRFGIWMGLIFLIACCLFFVKYRYNGAVFSFGISLIFFSSALFAPNLLKGLYIIWMGFAFILAWVNTKIILIIMFYLIFTPIGLFMKLLKIDLLERKKTQDTYWKQKDTAFQPMNYERRF